MRSFTSLAAQDAGRPVVADDVLEFHAARILLLLRYCGVRNRARGQYGIDGLTKMAKLDFFVRYPAFFRVVGEPAQGAPSQEATESPMIRYQYGPWDSRYYHVLGYLVSRQLIDAERDGTRVCLFLTEAGRGLAESMARNDSFQALVDHMRQVGGSFRTRSGNYLKTLIYRQFDAEVGQLKWGEAITG